MELTGKSGNPTIGEKGMLEGMPVKDEMSYVLLDSVGTVIKSFQISPRSEEEATCSLVGLSLVNSKTGQDRACMYPINIIANYGKAAAGRSRHV